MFYFTGDIHGNVAELIYNIDTLGISASDTVVLLGDVGLNYYSGKKDRINKDFLNRVGVTILCIHGNHEMRPQTIPTYIEKEWHGGIVYVEEQYPNLLFAKDGEIYDFDGQSAVAIGGAYSVDKFYRLARGWAWFNDEQPSDEIKRRVEDSLDAYNWNVDLVLTHTCPSKYIPTEALMEGLDQSTVDRSTEEWLDGIENRLEYKHWFCGHWHIDKRIDKMHFLFHDFVSMPL